ncbi:hypothetical protein ACIBH1_37625 [Nonomuraea sp. NPDC050663]
MAANAAFSAVPAHGDARQAEDLLQSVLLKVLGRWSQLAPVERPEARRC